MEYIHSLFRFGMNPGLERTRELLRRLGDPHRAGFRVVHVTGTNGKGSTSAMVAGGLRAAGHRTGLYISPFLERWNERVQLDGEPITDQDVADLVAEVRPHVDAMVANGFDQPTEFEVTTALAFLYYGRRGTDWVVLEVGLGGRYDATNVVADPAVTCITNVSLDHTKVLGDTPEEIALDKAGILKPGAPCVTCVRHPGALEVLRAESARLGAPLVEVAVPAGTPAGALGGQAFDWPGLPGLHTPLLGRHQIENAACAVTILQLCGVPGAAIRQGLAAVTWPGRFEVLRREPPVVLDGAHNEAGAAALAATVREYLGGRPLTLVLGVLSDKHVDRVLAHLLPLAQQVVCVEPANPKRAMPAEQLARRAAPWGKPCSVADSIPGALELALALCGQGALLVTGSLYLVGPARTWLRCSASVD